MSETKYNDSTFSTEQLIGAYLKVRADIKAADAEHAKRTAPLYAAKEKLNDMLLARLGATGTDSLSVRGLGTVYRIREDRASLADPGAFRSWVIQTGQWDMTEWRAAKTAIRSYIEAGNPLPPGVNFSSRAVVGVRSAPKTAAPDMDS
jgi:hypothetical protein